MEDSSFHRSHLTASPQRGAVGADLQLELNCVYTPFGIFYVTSFHIQPSVFPEKASGSGGFVEETSKRQNNKDKLNRHYIPILKHLHSSVRPNMQK